jgi:hypothetical protein
MAFARRNRGRIIPDQTQALSHPTRLRILELFTRNKDRSLAANDLAADLAADYPYVKPGQIAYHVAVLKDAELIPAG